MWLSVVCIILAIILNDQVVAIRHYNENTCKIIEIAKETHNFIVQIPVSSFIREHAKQSYYCVWLRGENGKRVAETQWMGIIQTTFSRMQRACANITVEIIYLKNSVQKSIVVGSNNRGHDRISNLIARNILFDSNSTITLIVRQANPNDALACVKHIKFKGYQKPVAETLLPRESMVQRTTQKTTSSKNTKTTPHTTKTTSTWMTITSRWTKTSPQWTMTTANATKSKPTWTTAMMPSHSTSSTSHWPNWTTATTPPTPSQSMSSTTNWTPSRPTGPTTPPKSSHSTTRSTWTTPLLPPHSVTVSTTWSPPNWPPSSNTITTPPATTLPTTDSSDQNTTSIEISPITPMTPYDDDHFTWQIIAFVFIGLASLLLIVTFFLFFSMPRRAAVVGTAFSIPRPNMMKT